MKTAAAVVFALGMILFGVSLVLPANNDWLGLFWGLYAIEVLLRGPAGVPDYALYALVTLGNLVVLAAPFAFAAGRGFGVKVIPLVLVAATVGAALVCVRYHPQTWAIGFYSWSASFLLLAISLHLRGRAMSRGSRRAEGSQARDLSRALDTLRRGAGTEGDRHKAA